MPSTPRLMLGLLTLTAVVGGSCVFAGYRLGNTIMDAGRKSAQPVALLQGAPQAQAAPVGAESGEALPAEAVNLELQGLDGQSFRLSDFKGRVVVLDLWASWCPTCRAQIPNLIKLKQEFGGRAVEVIGLTFEKPEDARAEVQKTAQDLGINYRVGFMPRETAMKFALLNQEGKLPVPQTFVLNRNGRVVQKAIVMEDAEMRRAVQSEGV